MTTTVRKGAGRARTNAKREKAAQRNPVVAVKPDPLTWAAALKLAGGTLPACTPIPRVR